MGNFSQKIDTKEQEIIKNRILAKFEVVTKQKQYTFWELKNSDFTATFYESGKFVIQGKNIDELLDYLGFLTTSKSVESNNVNKNIIEIPFPHIGTDESGKGDFFGPLVIAGVLVNEKNRSVFENLGIRDSKTLKDGDMLKMAKDIQKNAVFSVIAISNDKYNELYKNFKNLNKLLAWGHAKVIENILEKSECKYALSDKFGDESLIINALQTRGKGIILEQRTKAEQDIAVASASVLARATFVEKISAMERFYGVQFPKGCNNIVKNKAQEFIDKYGKNRLSEVCKTHFKTYTEL